MIVAYGRQYFQQNNIQIGDVNSINEGSGIYLNDTTVRGKHLYKLYVIDYTLWAIPRVSPLFRCVIIVAYRSSYINSVKDYSYFGPGLQQLNDPYDFIKLSHLYPAASLNP